jgi:hypothetical protein
MSRFLCLVFCALVATLASWAQPDETDPIKAKLTAAKTAFDAQKEKFADSIAKQFDAREAAARKEGSKKLLDELKIERKHFDEKGLLPRATTAAVRQQMLTAIAKLDAAYELAIKQYTMVKKDEQATSVSREQNAFKRQIERFASGLDFFQVDTVWKGSYSSVVVVKGKMKETRMELDMQVVDRDGKSFKLAISYGDGVQAEADGTIEKGKLEWKRMVEVEKLDKFRKKQKMEFTIDFTAVLRDDKLYFDVVDNSTGNTGRGVLALDRKKK